MAEGLQEGGGATVGRLTENRVFAAAEVVCFWLSLLTLLWLPLQLAAVRLAWLGPLPDWWSRQLLPVLLSAAIGYLTNRIAISMLFKPYQPGGWHFFTVLTLGYWRQGLLPRNKQRIAVEVGREVAGQLLRPEEISDELCRLAGDFLHDPALLPAMRSAVQEMLLENRQALADFLLPRVESALRRGLQEALQVERVRSFCSETLLPQLLSGGNRRLLAEEVISALREKAPQLVGMLRQGCQEYLTDYLEEKLPGVVRALLSPEELAGGLCRRIDWQEIQRLLEARIGTDEVRQLLGDEVERGAERLRAWLASPAGAERLQQFVAGHRAAAENWLREYLQEQLPVMIGEALQSAELPGWIDRTLRERVRPFLERLIREQGKDRVIAALNIEERIRTAVEGQNVREFHAMINRLAAEHLGAIQVLGYVLGGAIGLLQVMTA